MKLEVALAVPVAAVENDESAWEFEYVSESDDDELANSAPERKVGDSFGVGERWACASANMLPSEPIVCCFLLASGFFPTAL